MSESGSGEVAGMTSHGGSSPASLPDDEDLLREILPRLPLLQMSKSGSGEVADMTSRGGSSPASLTDDEDLLREIFLRLPPQPSSLPRASAVCRQWWRLATDPKFVRRFREHHRKPPPLLGIFEYHRRALVFNSVLDPPDRIPPERFDLGSYSPRGGYRLLSCRHGRLLILDTVHKQLVVCAPITGEQRRVAIRPVFKKAKVFHKVDVVCAAGDLGHVHGECHSGPFKMVFLSVFREDRRPMACVYSSETGLWGSLIPTAHPCSSHVNNGRPGVLIGNALYWLVIIGMTDSILEFDLKKQSLVVLDAPHINNALKDCRAQIIRAEDGDVGFAYLSYPSLQMWKRSVNALGVATWVVWKTIETHNIIELPPQIQRPRIEVILSYAEDADVVFIKAGANAYMVQLNPVQYKRLHETHCRFANYPFTSFYTPGEGTTAAVVVEPITSHQCVSAELISCLNRS